MSPLSPAPPSAQSWQNDAELIVRQALVDDSRKLRSFNLCRENLVFQMYPCHDYHRWSCFAAEGTVACLTPLWRFFLVGRIPSILCFSETKEALCITVTRMVTRQNSNMHARGGRQTRLCFGYSFLVLSWRVQLKTVILTLQNLQHTFAQLHFAVGALFSHRSHIARANRMKATHGSPQCPVQEL